ncbi:hypothetical protein TNCV_4231031 [Trichonephila clavipes]|uniref:Uncharacterized protein n=1 Tax=Trichonephila clavipes TaxID=2585209 RepID=A0A8X6VLC0_TRICX|nr:hypothetical protein TNCV_4231031 [Trichonephila clavipes]
MMQSEYMDQSGKPLPEIMHELNGFRLAIGVNRRDFWIEQSKDIRRRDGVNCHRLSNSLASDAIYCVSNNTVKSSKHITLGMTVKNLTSSRKMINILNRLGHCCNYNTLEELETEATISSVNRSQICLPDIIQSPSLSTGVAFDNFDRYVDTLTGKDTLHDTVGIIYQN